MSSPAVRGGSLRPWHRATNLYFRAERLYHSAFLDHRKQDALDLCTGTYQYGPDSRSFDPKGAAYGALHMGALFTAWGLLQLVLVLLAPLRPAVWDLFLQVGVPLLVGLGLLGYVWYEGPNYLARPQLCPESHDVAWAARQQQQKQQAGATTSSKLGSE
eukprot:CAMPEP_0202904442 /NCGR_PEP_ID=MMETSP1392-20130828/29393_1 /ASSEMBLY_ACC=CAM_ASM_000868 /TAXON_ID=225041 /ORGANISM="Chlamydomonas chlamydogama, Strain SAG 11-48b" /LENGTH=158 /DNA_ID=CAMNT_0049592055 /DNA_START=28 /DNA_END=504 /DNA_ORIENTATION=+